MVDASNQNESHAIAIIGMAGRFPGAKNCGQFWDNLCAGKESISRFSSSQLRDAGVIEDLLQSPQYVNARGSIDDVDLFDADFFGMSSAEAKITDPQQRLFLECAWEALENAGYCSEQYNGTVGVYGGCGTSSYYLTHIHGNQKMQQAFGNYLIHLGNEKDYLATRVSYKLDLKGPSLTVQTACSTSLTAVSIACTHLLSYQCDMAIAGGATISLPQESGYLYQKDMILSSDGCCRAFDADGNGTVPGNGVGIVVLKRLEDALANRDHIYAVIKGYGINNDGKAKVGYTAVSPQGQSEAVASALAMAEVHPESIQYIETHGTATYLGDPIEIYALKEAFGAYTQKKQFCAIGSVKSNIGHLFETAGIAGLIKASLALYHGKIPPSLHFVRPNPSIDFVNSPFYVNQSLQEWKREKRPRRAGVSSFGFGGTNVHLILEEAPEALYSQKEENEYLLVLSAKSSSALKEISKNLALYLQDRPDIPMRDVAYTLQVGRKSFDHRQAILCTSRMSAIEQLLMDDPKKLLSGTNLAIEGQKWMQGSAVDWLQLYSIPHPQRLPLPTYPFEKKRFWIEKDNSTFKSTSSASASYTLMQIQEHVHAIWKDFFASESISEEDDFFQLGGDSLLAAQIVAQIHSQLHASLKMHVLFEYPTISLLSKHIAQQLKAENGIKSSLLVQLKSGANREPLFCVHPIGGHVFCYKSLAEGMKYEGPIFGIQAPAFVEENAQSMASIEAIASYYLQAIKMIQPIGPYHLLGASFGGVVAYEMARQILAEGQRVALLTLLDAGRIEDIAAHETRMLNFLVELFEGSPIDKQDLSSFSKEEQIHRLMNSLGLQQLDSIIQKQVFEQITMSWNALLNYHPKSYPGKVLFFEAKKRFFRFPDLSLWTTWKNLVLEGIEYYEIEGDHLSMITSPGVQSIQRILEGKLSTE